jgi:hypothetical protein
MWVKIGSINILFCGYQRRLEIADPLNVPKPIPLYSPGAQRVIMSLEQQTNIASVKVFQASFADWYLFYMIEYLMYRDVWPHLILILACNWLPYVKRISFFKIWKLVPRRPSFIPRKSQLITICIVKKLNIILVTHTKLS